MSTVGEEGEEVNEHSGKKRKEEVNEHSGGKKRARGLTSTRRG